MKKAFFVLSLVICTFISSLYSEIVETAHFSELAQVATDETLVICDIDDTLFIPTQTLGSDVWFYYRLQQYTAQGWTPENALEKALAEWESVRHVTNVKLVEHGTEKVVKSIQEKGITVIGLTTQGLALATRTKQQLASLGIDLLTTAPSREDYYFLNEYHGVLYRHGILFTSGTPKGPALLMLLNHIGYRPKKVIFINDKESHLLDVAQSLEKEGIPFLGMRMRYNYSDERVAAFNKELADFQFSNSSFERILSDEEVEALLQMPVMSN